MLDKRVVLLGSTFGQGLEPVSIVSYAILGSPLLDTSSYSVGNSTIQTCAIVHHVNHFLVHVFRQVLVHFLTVKDLLAEILSWSLTWCFYVEWLFLECLTDNLKS